MKYNVQRKRDPMLALCYTYSTEGSDMIKLFPLIKEAHRMVSDIKFKTDCSGLTHRIRCNAFPKGK